MSSQDVAGERRQAKFDELVREWDSTSAITSWEGEFSRLIDEWRAVEWRSGGTTLLSALGLHKQEVPLCRGLAWLLDPEGGHNFEWHFLDAFLTSLDLPASEGAPVHIRVEEPRTGTRADIVIRTATSTVVIEAKVLAGEQPLQADRLHDNWGHEAPKFVFLTQSGRLPVTALRSADLWTTRTWRELAQLARATADTTGLNPSSGAREFIETIWAL